MKQQLLKNLLYHLKKGKIGILLVVFFAYSQANANNSFKIKSEVEKLKYCLDKSPILSTNPRTNEIQEIASNSVSLKIWLKFYIENTSSTPIIIQKDYFAISRYFIAKSMRLYRKGVFLSDIKPFLELQFNSIDEPSPPNNKFNILQTNRSFTKEVEMFLDLGDRNFGIKNGNYWLGLTLNTWGGQQWAGAKSEKNWKDFGDLLIEPIKSEPISLKISKPKLIKDCKD